MSNALYALPPDGSAISTLLNATVLRSALERGLPGGRGRHDLAFKVAFAK